MAGSACDGFLALLKDMFVFKSAAVVCGWILKNAISQTLMHLLTDRDIRLRSETGDATSWSDGGDGKFSGRLTGFFVAMVTFSVLLCAAAGLATAVKKLQIPERARTSALASLGLIPAWAWKDVVSNFITMVTDGRLRHSDADKTGPIFNGLLALLVALASGGLQLFADRREGNAVIAQLKPSMGLGVGFAVNNVVKTIFADAWDKLAFQLPYTALASTAIPLAQLPMRRALDDRRESLSPLWVKMLDLLIISGNFVVGWAWKGLLDCLFGGKFVSDIGQLGVSIIVSLVLVALVFGTAMIAERLPKTLVDTLKLVAGMNSGWTWMDYASYLASTWVTNTLNLWVSCLVIIAVSLAWVIGMELLFQRCEAQEKAGEEGAELRVPASFTAGGDDAAAAASAEAGAGAVDADG